VFFRPFIIVVPKKLHPPPVQFLIRTSAEFTIAHKPAHFLTGPMGVLFYLWPSSGDFFL
jgi:hypothetical protein